jgi:uncharacterized protein
MMMRKLNGKKRLKIVSAWLRAMALSWLSANALRKLGAAAMVFLSAVSVPGCAWLDTNQRAAIYRPTFATATNFKGLEATDEVVYLSLGDTKQRITQSAANYARKQAYSPESIKVFTSAWWLPNANANAPTILYLHGVFRNLSYNYEKLQALREAGFHVLAVTYRGWPSTSAALPSEQSIYEDALRGFEELKLRQPDASKRIIYGHSLGGGVAVELASRLSYPNDYAALMLESTFTRLPDVGSELRWYGMFLKPFATQHFDSIDKIKRIKAPVLVRHGEADNTVPFILGKRLFEAANEPRRFVAFEGGSHSGLHTQAPELYRESLQKFWQEIVKPSMLTTQAR